MREIIEEQRGFLSMRVITGESSKEELIWQAPLWIDCIERIVQDLHTEELLIITSYVDQRLQEYLMAYRGKKITVLFIGTGLFDQKRALKKGGIEVLADSTAFKPLGGRK
jgi:hypothetical protein